MGESYIDHVLIKAQLSTTKTMKKNVIHRFFDGVSFNEGAWNWHLMHHFSQPLHVFNIIHPILISLDPP